MYFVRSIESVYEILIWNPFPYVFMIIHNFLGRKVRYYKIDNYNLHVRKASYS